MAHLRNDFGVLESRTEEKLQCRDPGIQIATGDSLFNQVQLIAPEIFGSGGVRRTLQKACEIDNPAEVAVWVFGESLRNVMSSIMRWRSGLMCCAEWVMELLHC